MTRFLGTNARVLTLVMASVSAVAVIRGHVTQGYSFYTLDPAFAQHVFASTALGSGRYLGGVVVLQNGDVIAAECQTNGTKLHRFSATATYVNYGTTLHQETTMSTAGGCGIALHPNGYLYSNMRDSNGVGVAQIDLATGDSVRMGPAGNALGIAVDPVSNHLVYAGAGCKPAFGPPPCILFDLDPVSRKATNFAVLDVSQIGYVDGVSFEPTGAYLFLTNRYPAYEVVVLNRSGAIVRRVPMPSEPVGMGFHLDSPTFLVTNNQDGTMTRIEAPNNDYTAPPVITQFASGGFRGDLLQAGPDGCIYVTQNGTRYDNGEQDNKANSIVQICGGFAPPPGITRNPPPPSSLCGFVYNDSDNDGINEPAEAGIPGTVVRLTGSDYLGRVVSLSTTTGSNGSYCFTSLNAGDYTISETQPPGYLDGKDTQGTPGTGTAGNDSFNDIVLDAGVDGRNNNFGELLPSSLCGFVYVDPDNNGVKAAGEAGIPGATVTLTGSDDRGTVNMPMTTGADGAYCFMSLRPGTYTITETQPPGYADGRDTQGTPGTGTTGNDVFSNITLGQNISGQNNNFGEAVGTPRITLVKKTNGTDNDTGTGPLVAVGSTVTWTYVVTNTGNVTLSNLTVSDDKAGAVSCPGTTLAPGATITCTKSGTAIAGQYTNIGTVTASNGAGQTVTASNPDNYFGVAPAVSIVKKTNGTDNDAGTGPIVPVGSTVTWTYAVTNTGNVALSNVAVTDDKLGAVACPRTTLNVGDTFTCTATGTAVAGQYTNVGTVTAVDTAGRTVSASNRDGYFGARPAISLVKKTNGTDNDAGTGPIVPAGSVVTWTYIVTNSGNVTLSNIAVTDDKAGAITCPAATLAAGASFTCSKTGTAIVGQYTNVGTVTASDVTGQTVTASNADAYFGANPAITLVKTTNGTDNDTAPGPTVPAGSAVTWAYTVTNVGNVTLSNIAVTDNKIGAIGCPTVTLAVRAVMTCTKTGVAVAGQYTNIGTVTARDVTGRTVSASNPDNYFGAGPGISIVKKTNGTDNDTGTGPTINVGSPVTWTYIVTNTGNVPLSNVAVVDDKAGPVACPAAMLAVGATMTCTKIGVAITGQYTNVGSVTATDSTGRTVSAQNVDHYLGVVPPAADLGITVSAPATVVAGTTLNYTLNAVNTGTFTANDVAVAYSVPPNLKFVSLSRPAGWSCVTPAAGGAGTITCTKASMAVAERASFSIAVGSSCPVPNAGSVTLAATISSSTPDPNPLNNAGSATTTIVNPAPVISNVRVNPSTMWPPNHKMWDVRVDYTVAGGCGGAVTTRLDVASNEATNGTDWEILDAHNMRLRSERNGGGSGRVYTISIIATDPITGMSTTSTVEVTVVHDQGNGKR